MKQLNWYTRSVEAVSGSSSDSSHFILKPNQNCRVIDVCSVILAVCKAVLLGFA